MRFPVRILTALVAVTPFLGPAVPAHADTIAGKVYFEGTAAFPNFPCPPPYYCTGYFTTAGGTAIGTVVTSGGGVRIVNQISAAFSYNESCITSMPLVGTASGTATLYFDGGGSMNVPFQWTRIGLGATISGPFSGAATFVPAALPNCAAPQSLTATIGGTVAAAPPAVTA